MPLVPFFIDMINSIGRARAHYRTERIMNSLPLAIQKDIGWPNVLEPCCPRMHIIAGNSHGISSGKC